MERKLVEDTEVVDEYGIPEGPTICEAASKQDAAKVAKREASSLYRDLSDVTTDIIRAINALRKLTAIRGKDMSLWRHQKGASSDQVKDWVERLHQLGYLNADLDKALDSLMKIENEIRTYLGK